MNFEDINNKLNSDEKIEADVPKPSGLHTFASDMAKLVNTGEGSVMNVALAQLEKKEEGRTNVGLHEKKDPLWLILTFIAIALGVGIFFVILKIQDKKISALPTETSFIFAETHKKINIADKERPRIVNEIKNEITAGGERSSLKSIKLTNAETELSIEEFMAVIGPRASGSLVRSFNPSYMLGAYNSEINDPFILFTSNSYEQSFAGMLAWENRMADDLYEIFSLTPETLNNNFRDVIVKNKDARILSDENGDVAIMYLFINPNTLVITQSESALDEVLNRYYARGTRK